ncbi:hypothetical protein KFE94_00235 [bacterium SCSIO 12643]|nr:hypothetical protein KFE94_00235 [bacterium SCSIO 12643]
MKIQFKIVLLGLINSILSWIIASIINAHDHAGIHSTGMVSLIAMLTAIAIFILNVSYLIGWIVKNRIIIFIACLLPSTIVMIMLLKIYYADPSDEVIRIVLSTVVINLLLSLWPAYWMVKLKFNDSTL